jgi:hypothetical protein
VTRKKGTGIEMYICGWGFKDIYKVSCLMLGDRYIIFICIVTFKTYTFIILIVNIFFFFILLVYVNWTKRCFTVVFHICMYFIRLPLCCYFFSPNPPLTILTVFSWFHYAIFIKIYNVPQYYSPPIILPLFFILIVSLQNSLMIY